MITIDIEFYHRTQNHLIDEMRIDLPDEIVFTAAGSVDVNYINARPFEITDSIKNYAIEKYPDLTQKFEKYDAYFIGRHGLGPEYD